MKPTAIIASPGCTVSIERGRPPRRGPDRSWLQHPAAAEEVGEIGREPETNACSRPDRIVPLPAKAREAAARRAVSHCSRKAQDRGDAGLRKPGIERRRMIGLQIGAQQADALLTESGQRCCACGGTPPGGPKARKAEGLREAAPASKAERRSAWQCWRRCRARSRPVGSTTNSATWASF